MFRISTKLVCVATTLGLALSFVDGVPFSTAASVPSQAPASVTTRAMERRKARLARLHRSSSSSSASSQAPIAGPETTYSRCTATAWSCGPYSACSDGTQTRFCTLMDSNCLNPNDVEPPKTLSCRSGPLPVSPIDAAHAQMKSNLDAWKGLHDQLTDKMKTLANQPHGAGCIAPLASIENDLVTKYNEYLDIYEHSTDLALKTATIQNIEEAMLHFADQITKAPFICY
jgi:hypothetical protein